MRSISSQKTRSRKRHQYRTLQEDDARNFDHSLRENLEHASQAAHQFQRRMSSILQQHYAQKHKILQPYFEQYPTLQGAYASDIERSKKRFLTVEVKLHSAFRAIKSVLSRKQTAESLQRTCENIIEEYSHSTISPLHEDSMFSLGMLRTLTLPENTKQFLADVLLAALGFAVVLYINTSIFQLLHPLFPPGVATLLGSVLAAPLIEETLKLIQVRFTGRDFAPALFAIGEFFLYMQQILLVATSVGPPLGFVVLLLGILVRLWVIEMHLFTTRMYLLDYQAKGYIAFKRFLQGVGFHALWNLLATITPGVGIIIGHAIMQAYGSLYAKLSPPPPSMHPTLAPG